MIKKNLKESKKRRITENIDTWRDDIKKIVRDIMALELPTDEGTEQTVYSQLASIRAALDSQLKDYKELTGVSWKKGKRESKKSMRESKLRSFDRNDWNSFAGAERFDDGSEPLIAEFADGSITLIVSGVDNEYDEENEAIVQLLYLNDGTDEEGGWYKDFESRKDAMKFALEISTELDYYTPEDTEYDDVENCAHSNGMDNLY